MTRSVFDKARVLAHYAAQARAAERHLAGESYEQITRRVHRYEAVICTACQGTREDRFGVTLVCRFCGGSGETEQELLS